MGLKKLSVALYTSHPGLDQSLMSSLGEKMNFQSKEDSDLDLSGFDAILCLEFKSPERAETLHYLAQKAIDDEIDVIWIVQCDQQPAEIWDQIAEELRNKNQWVPQNLRSISTGNDVEDVIRQYHIAWQEKQLEKSKQSPPAPATLNLRGVDSFSAQTNPSFFTEPASTSFAPPGAAAAPATNASLGKIIAVGGMKGAGSSFVAWNLAALLGSGIVLVEGRTTGTLAHWLRISALDTRKAFLEYGTNVATQAGDIHLAVTGSTPMTSEDLSRLYQIANIAVVDVGDDTQGIVWMNASVRVFVTTPDPQWENQPLPQNAIKVMNRLPDDYPASPHDIFKTQMDLTLPDLGRQAWISLWARRAWLATAAPQELKARWLAAFQTTNTTGREATNSWQPATSNPFFQ